MKEEVAEDESVLYYEGVPHKGAVNRLRTMHGSSIVATWSDDAEVSIFDLKEAIQRVDLKSAAKSNVISQKKYSSLINRFKHKVEGYALDWSPLVKGLLASGSCDSTIYLYHSNESEFIMDKQPLKGHKDSVEDLQFSPNQDFVFASCSVDKTIRIWDIREGKRKAQITFEAHSTDVNVISWNTFSKHLLASGADDGNFRVWDMRKLDTPITDIHWHTAPITSIQFQP